MTLVVIIVLAGIIAVLLWELRSRTNQLVASQARTDEVRRQVERDLHDGAQQRIVLTMLKLGVLARSAEDHAETLTDIRTELQQALAEVREIARGAAPPALESDGLVPALSDVAARSAASISADGVGRYEPVIEAEVYFCCVEALQNAAKHAGPKAKPVVRLAQRDDRLTFEVRDQGKGFDLDTVPRGRGLSNITERIAALGGTVRVSSAPGEGTRVEGHVLVA
jgi:signal transduction histidine kinase